MRTEQERRRRFIITNIESREKINELDLAARRYLSENLSGDLPTGERKLLVDVSPRFFESFRAGRPRAKIDKLLNMRQRFFAGKFFPDFLRFCACDSKSHRNATRACHQRPAL